MIKRKFWRMRNRRQFLYSINSRFPSETCIATSRKTQDFNQDQIFKKLEHNLEYLLDVISFNQRQDRKR